MKFPESIDEVPLVKDRFCLIQYNVSMWRRDTFKPPWPIYSLHISQNNLLTWEYSLSCHCLHLFNGFPLFIALQIREKVIAMTYKGVCVPNTASLCKVIHSSSKHAPRLFKSVPQCTLSFPTSGLWHILSLLSRTLFLQRCAWMLSSHLHGILLHGILERLSPATFPFPCPFQLTESILFSVISPTHSFIKLFIIWIIGFVCIFTLCRWFFFSIGLWTPSRTLFCLVHHCIANT